MAGKPRPTSFPRVGTVAAASREQRYQHLSRRIVSSNRSSQENVEYSTLSLKASPGATSADVHQKRRVANAGRLCLKAVDKKQIRLDTYLPITRRKQLLGTETPRPLTISAGTCEDKVGPTLLETAA